MRVLRVVWVAAPIANAAVLLTAYAAHTGPLPTSTPPWPWAFEAALVSYLVLTVPPRVATACTVGSALLPMASAAVFLGGIPPEVLVDTPIHVANVIYIAIFSGIRVRLNRLREAEARALAAEAARVRAEASARGKEQVARLIHDEVLSVLAAARFRGAPPDPLRAGAGTALGLFHRPVVDQNPGSLTTALAADWLVGVLRRFDAEVAIDLASVPGEVPRAVVETVGAAAAEALRNSLRHAAGAERAVDVVTSPRLVEVSVEDRGPGFDVDRVDAQRLGIRGSILERMRTLPGGGAVVDSQPGGGTRVVVTWRI
jgi:signal transduction histidine kinase